MYSLWDVSHCHTHGWAGGGEGLMSFVTEHIAVKVMANTTCHGNLVSTGCHGNGQYRLSWEWPVQVVMGTVSTGCHGNGSSHTGTTHLIS